MVLFLVLIAVFGLTMLGCAPIAVLGLVRKKKKMMFSGVIGFFIGLAGISALSIIYSESAYSYVNGEPEIVNTGSAGGAENGNLSTGISKGLSENIHDESVAGISERMKGIFDRSVKAVVSTPDSVLGERSIFIDKSIEDAGIKPGKAEEHIGPSNFLSVALNFGKDFNGKLVLTSYNQDGSKLGEKTGAFQGKAGESQDAEFEISSPQTNLKIYYVLFAEE